MTCLLSPVALWFKIQIKQKVVISCESRAKIRWIKWQSLTKGYIYFFFQYADTGVYKPPFVKAEIVQIHLTLIKIFNKASIDTLLHSAENKLASIDVPAVTPWIMISVKTPL